MNFLKKLVDLYLYSSVHIALGAFLSVILCYSVFYHIPGSDYPLFVFFSTVFLYCAHRVIGIEKVKMFQGEGRFAVIKAHKIHLLIYTILAGLAMIFFFLRMQRHLQLWLLLPGAISIMYVLPLFGDKKRLRDYFQIKIYLIAIIWGMIIAFIPYIEAEGAMDLKGIIYFLEKTIFIFAITIPFDIRDLRVDKTMEVNTIPHEIGLRKAYRLTYGLMILTIFLVLAQYFLDTYSIKMAVGITIGYLLTILFIKLSEKKTHDYFYAGILDGTISLVAIIGILLSGILGVVF